MISVQTTTHHVHELEPLKQFTVSVLQPVSLVNDHTAPRNTAQLRTVSQNHLKRCDNGVKFIGSLYHTALAANIHAKT